MSQDIIKEVVFLLRSFLMGIIITVVYDCFLILRRLIKHRQWLISLEDFLFWFGCAISVFYMLNKESNGILRWFAVVGAALGMLLYKKSLSSFIVNIMSTSLLWIFKVTSKPLLFFERKTCFIFRVFIRKIRKILKYIKNKLTARLKLLRMVLCKHKS